MAARGRAGCKRGVPICSRCGCPAPPAPAFSQCEQNPPPRLCPPVPRRSIAPMTGGGRAMPARDIAYSHAGIGMLGHFEPPADGGPRPGILLVHGAHGLDDFIIGIAGRLSAQGYAVLALDLWGGRARPQGPDAVGAALGGCARDRAGWMARVEAARAALTAQPEVDGARIGALGYCFGGSTVLEYVRTGGALTGGVSFHAGLDLVEGDWSAATKSPLLVCAGAADPMSGAEDLTRITGGMEAAGVPWELNLYGGVKHAFTEPDDPRRPPFAKYDANADRRSWAAMSDFFAHLFD
ncbi:dienelactone hydrolase family protein [Sinirhodobacter populi]|uniref:Dienelactone hydrolase family protein n=2 Tax=Paenirhodobacter populi TaxID=2306993 RepID=A0A443KPQ7_9RHOB|nr:dienelactone hydrolase family protein [Sinirhodobacter populi]